MKKLITVAVSALCAAVAFTSFAEVWNIPAGDVAALETALADYAKGDEIVLAKGTYSLTKTLSNKSGVAVTVRGATGNPEDVIIDGQGKVRCLYLFGSGSAKVVPENPDNAVKLYDLTVCNGYNDSVADYQSCIGGGGAYVGYGIVKNCIFKDCKVESQTAGSAARGGGLFAKTVAIENCVFEGCSVSANGQAWGGAIACWKGGGQDYGFSLVDTVIRSCKAISNGNKTYTALGGGICANVSMTSISNVVFESCSVTNTVDLAGMESCSAGGAVYTFGCLAFNDCLFTNCCAYGQGGAAYGSYASYWLAATNTTFVGCRANYVSALSAQGAVYLDNCLFKTNVATRSQGAVYGVTEAKIHSSLFLDNVSGGEASVLCLGYRGQNQIQNSYDNEIVDSVFEGNVSTATATCGPVLLRNFANKIERCIFKENKCAKAPDDWTTCGGTAIFIERSVKSLLIRNCFATGGSGAPVVACANQDPRFPSETSYQFENCTIANNVLTPWNNKYGSLIWARNTISWPYFTFRNCCFLGNAGCTQGVFDAKILVDSANTITYCAADDGTGFPAEENECILVDSFKKCRNKGHNEDWMTDATDGGDGTYSVAEVGNYGVTVAMNNLKRRIIGDTVDIGAQEMTIPGLLLMVR